MEYTAAAAAVIVKQTKAGDMIRCGKVLVMVLALGFLVAGVSSSQLRPRGGYEGEGKSSSNSSSTGLCCDRCGGCTETIPRRCKCLDVVISCHPLCKKCAKSPNSGKLPVYQCKDRLPNFCDRACSPDARVGA